MSNHIETLEKITNIIKALGGDIDQSNVHSLALSDLGLDSLQTMDLILSVEEKFDIQIPDDRLNSQYLHSISAIAKLVVEIVGEEG